jgi:hypothetical protein
MGHSTVNTEFTESDLECQFYDQKEKKEEEQRMKLGNLRRCREQLQRCTLYNRVRALMPTFLGVLNSSL